MRNLVEIKNLIIVFVAVMIIINGQAQSTVDVQSHQKSKKAIQEFLDKDPGLQERFDQAYGYVVFPAVGKGAIGIGGAHGNGIVFEEGNPIADARMTQISWGLQWGGQSYREVIFFETREALDSFKENKFEFAAQASAVAVTSGASVDAAYEKGVSVFTMARGGLMYEASIGGQKFKYLPGS